MGQFAFPIVFSAGGLLRSGCKAFYITKAYDFGLAFQKRMAVRNAS